MLFSSGGKILDPNIRGLGNVSFFEALVPVKGLEEEVSTDGATSTNPRLQVVEDQQPI